MNNKRAQIQSEALKATEGLQRCGLGISMGVGKTLIGLKHMNNVYQKDKASFFLIVAPKKSIFDSWIDDAKKFNMDYLIDHMEFTTYLSLTKKDTSKYKAVYLDECHSLLYNHQIWLKFFGGIVLGLTGTPPRYINSEKGDMVNTYCPIVYKYITDDAINDSILNDYRIRIHGLDLETDIDYRVTAGSKSFYTSEVKNYEYWCNRIDNATSPKEIQITRIMRMKALMGYNTKLRYTNYLLKSNSKKCLIFCNTQDQADSIAKHSYHSKNPNSDENLRRFKKGEFNVLSCVQSLSEGVNIPDLKHAIILHSYSNERKSLQRIGRVLRLNPEDMATIDILMYKNTADVDWVKSALKDLDRSKIKYYVKKPEL